MNDREKLIALIENAKKAMKSENLSCNIARNGFVADFLIANGVTIQRWIPVEERLPEFDQKVLCYKKGEIKIGKYIGARYTGEIYAFRTLDMYMAFGATHWMPLPEPPKEVK